MAHPYSPSKPTPSTTTSSSIQVIEKVAFMEAVAERSGGMQTKSPTGRTRPGWSASPLRRSGVGVASSPVKEEKPSPNGKGLTRPTVGLLSPRKVISKKGVASPSGNRVLTTASQAKSPSYCPSSPPKSPSYHPTSPRRYCLRLRIGKVLHPLLKGIPIESVESSSIGIHCHRSPPPSVSCLESWSGQMMTRQRRIVRK